MDTKIPEAVINDAGICQNCFIKFNEYDEHLSIANQIQIELMTMFNTNNTAIETVAAFVDIKQEVKVEKEDFYFGIDENSIVEVVDDDVFAKDAKKKTSAKTSKPVITAVMSGAYRPQRDVGNRSTFVKKDKDAGLIVRMVDGIKHYQCEFCGKKDFTSRSRLKTHMQIHTNERNYMCQVVIHEVHKTLANDH